MTEKKKKTLSHRSSPRFPLPAVTAPIRRRPSRLHPPRAAAVMAEALEKSPDPHPFPADIEYSILLRLPIKSLKRFQCVCKSWFSLISSPQFQNDHFAIAQRKPPLLLTLQCKGGYDDAYKRDDLTPCFSAYNNNTTEGTLTLFNNFSVTVREPCYMPYIQSCLGLVCLFCRFSGQPTLVCNPSTQDLISLPTNKGANVSIGFGFAASTQELKVVRVYYGEGKYRCEVFTLRSLGTGQWREVSSPVNRIGDGCAPFLHGAVHFLPHVPYAGVKDTDCITVFDIDSEEYREAIPLPAYYYSLGDCEGRGILLTRDFLRFSKLRGSLCLTFDYGELKCYLELWLLKDYDSVEWVKGYTIDVSTIFPYPSYSFWAYPADTMEDDILLNCSDDEGVKILCYDPRDGTLSVKKDEEWAATFYVETFYTLRRR